MPCMCIVLLYYSLAAKPGAGPPGARQVSAGRGRAVGPARAGGSAAPPASARSTRLSLGSQPEHAAGRSTQPGGARSEPQPACARSEPQLVQVDAREEDEEALHAALHVVHKPCRGAGGSESRRAGAGSAPGPPLTPPLLLRKAAGMHKQRAAMQGARSACRAACGLPALTELRAVSHRVAAGQQQQLALHPLGELEALQGAASAERRRCGLSSAPARRKKDIRSCPRSQRSSEVQASRAQGCSAPWPCPAACALPAALPGPAHSKAPLPFLPSSPVMFPLTPCATRPCPL